MSSVAISGNASGAGVFTIAAPNSASSFTATLPAATTTLVGTDATQTLTNKTLTSPTLTTPNIDSAQVATVSGTAPLYMCRAWVNFNGTGTVAIRASGNVTNITDTAVGSYSVNFTTAISDADYSFSGSVRSPNVTNRFLVGQVLAATQSTTALPFTVVDSNAGTNTDCPTVNILVIR